MPRKTDSNNPADWLAIAESELEAVQILARQEVCCDMCRGKLAEILEKMLKAELIRPFFKTDSMGVLQIRPNPIVPTNDL